ncbi:hypothetical protein [Streptomyces sp. NPDC037389]|uniref:hypothetical protein n=1 Tax=Streptomyces sp. NPDC037389 TaxID=3155369 RepID=UPI003410A8E4
MATTGRTVRLALIGAAVVGLVATSAAVVGYAASRDGGSHDDARPGQAQSPSTLFTVPKPRTAPKPLTSSPPSALPLPSSPSGGSAAPTPAPDGRSHGGSQAAPDAPGEAPGPGGGPEKPGGSGGGGDSASGIPLTVAVRPYVSEDPCSQLYLTDRQPLFMPAPPEVRDNRGWAENLRAVAGGQAKVELSVQGKGAEAVVLHAARVRVVNRSAPLSWAAYVMGSGCGGGLTPSFHDIDLDADQPVARPASGRQGDIKVPATDFPYRVTSTDPQVLEVVGRTESHDVSWYLELEWSSGDRHGTVRVDDNGRPFRTSAVKDRPQYSYWMGKNVWTPVEDEYRSK